MVTLHIYTGVLILMAIPYSMFFAKEKEKIFKKVNEIAGEDGFTLTDYEAQLMVSVVILVVWLLFPLSIKKVVKNLRAG